MSNISSPIDALRPPTVNLFKLDKSNTAGKVGTNSLTTYSCGPLHMDEQKQEDQFRTYIQQPIQDETLESYRGRWTIEMGGEKGSGRSVLVRRHDDDVLPVRTEPNAAEVTKNVCRAKGEDAVDHSTVTRWSKKFCSDCRSLNDKSVSGRPKTVNSEAILQAKVDMALNKEN